MKATWTRPALQSRPGWGGRGPRRGVTQCHTNLPSLIIITVTTTVTNERCFPRQNLSPETVSWSVNPRGAFHHLALLFGMVPMSTGVNILTSEVRNSGTQLARASPGAGGRDRRLQTLSR